MTEPHPSEDRLISMALGDLDAAAECAVEAHLVDCAACREIVLALRGALESYRVAPAPEAPASVLVDLLEAQARLTRATLRREARSARRRRRWWLAPLPAAAFLLLLLAGAFWVGRETAPQSARAGARPGASGGGLVVDLGDLPELPPIPFQVVAAFDST